MFKLGVITDEVSQDIEIACAFAKKHGLDVLEIRSVDDKGPFALTEADAIRIRKTADAYGLQIAAISAPLFKCDIDDAAAYEAQLAGFENCIMLCKIFGCKLIRGFDFWECGAPLSRRAEAYEPIIAMCRENDVQCVIEYDPSVHSCTPQKLKPLLEAIDSPCIGGLFDPGNAIWVNGDAVPYPDDYWCLQGKIKHIHIKDAVIENGQAKAVKVGTGFVDYKGLFTELIKSGYEGCVMLETHYRKSVELTEEQLKRPGGASFSNGAYEASEESILAIKNILEEIL